MKRLDDDDEYDTRLSRYDEKKWDNAWDNDWEENRTWIPTKIWDDCDKEFTYSKRSVRISRIATFDSKLVLVASTIACIFYKMLAR